MQKSRSDSFLAHSSICGKDRQLCNGFTLTEIVVVVVIMSALVVVLLNRMQVYQEIAEKAAMQRTIVVLQSALNLRVASYMVKGRLSELEVLAQDNPMNWLSRKPDNYLGEYTYSQFSDITPGNWYFDVTHHELVYLAKQGAYSEPNTRGEMSTRLRVVLLWGEALSPDSAYQKPVGVALEKIEAYAWGAI